MEEVFGEIEDEHDNNKYVAKDLGNGEYLLSARLEIEHINEQFDLDLPESEDYLTLGGLILHQYQRFPKPNELVEFGHWEIKIIECTRTKIELVRLKVLK
jgi:CBS domain containing-hemolysin-like protein